MNGRLHSELSIEKKNDAKVAKMPSYVGRWYLSLKASRRTAATCRDYISKVHHFLQFINPNVLNVKLSDITEDVVMRYFLSIQTKEENGEISYTSDSYQLTVWCCLNSFLSYLYSSGMIEANYISSIGKPKNRDLDRINESRVMLTERDFKKIVREIRKEENETLRRRDLAIILLFMNTGMRKTALSNITMDDLDLEKHKLIVIDKGNKRHEYLLNDGMIEVLKDWIEIRGDRDDNHLFLSKRGREMHGNTLSNVVEKYTAAALGHGVSPHKLRSGYCSILYKKTGDIEFVRRCVGHTNATTTQRYIVTKGEEKERAAEMMASLF